MGPRGNGSSRRRSTSPATFARPPDIHGPAHAEHALAENLVGLGFSRRAKAMETLAEVVGHDAGDLSHGVRHRAS